MTPDGLKVLFRCIIDILKENVQEDILKTIKGELIEISVKTKGDLSKYSQIAYKSKFKETIG